MEGQSTVVLLWVYLRFVCAKLSGDVLDSYKGFLCRSKGKAKFGVVSAFLAPFQHHVELSGE